MARLETTPTAALRRGLAGLLLSGLILALPGALLPLWSHHLTSDYALAGTYFLALNLGHFLAIQTGGAILRRLGIRGNMIFASALAMAGFIGSIFAAPPGLAIGRQIGLFILGCAAGLLHRGIFRLAAPFYDRARAATVNLGGIVFGLGCLLAALLTAAIVETSFLWLPMAICATIAAWLLYWYALRPFHSEAENLPEAPATREGFRSPAAILLALLLFFQIGNEWSVAGWLPLFLIQRLGISPESALGLLAFYWAALLLGRVLTQWALPRMPHPRLLLASVFAAAFGCTILSLTNNLFGAVVAIMLLGSGFAMIFPLVVEMAGARFRYFHPAHFNSVSSMVLTGGFLAPWIVGLVTSKLGIGAALLVPLIGTIAVFMLLLLLWIDSRLNPVE